MTLIILGLMGIGDHKKVSICACRSNSDEENCCRITVNEFIFKDICHLMCRKKQVAILKVNILYRGIHIEL